MRELTIIKTKLINGVIYVYAKTGQWYGWYRLEPVETPDEKL